MTEPIDFFISYRHTQTKWAQWIAQVLEESGYKVHLDSWDLRGSANVVSYIDGALKRAARVLAVISTDYFDSRWTESEWTAAVASSIAEGTNRLVLVKVEPCRIDGILSPYRFVDLYKYDDDEKRRVLIESVDPQWQKPAAVPLPRHTGPTFASYYPRIWNVPDPNQFFAGRERELASLYEGLHRNHPAAITAAQGITGLGGVGKTQLAIEYAYRYRGEYDVVWWINAEGGGAVRPMLAGLAAALGLAENPPPEIDDALRALAHWLRGNARWLLIYDNVTEPHDVDGFLFPQFPGHVLLTSRHQNWGGLAKQVDIDVFPAEEAIEFVCHRTPGADASAAEQLAEQLGHLPLALEQACAYVEQMGLTVEEYCALYASHGMEALDDATVRGYPASVRTTWAISIEQIRRTSPASSHILRFLSFVAPEDVPVALLQEQSALLPEDVRALVSDAMELNRLIKPLRDYSLLKRSNRMLRVHRMVQTVVRDEQSPEQRQQWSASAVRVINAALTARSSHDLQQRIVVAQLLPHALAATTFAEEEDTALPEVVSVLDRVGTHQTQTAAFSDAEQTVQRAIRLSRKVHGEQHYETGILLNDLGQIYHHTRRLDQAREQYMEALAILVQHFGAEHETIATTLNNLAEAARELRQYDMARQLQQRALRIREQQLGRRHPAVAVSLNNLGLIALGLHEYREAEELFHRALEIDQTSRGRNHPAVAIDLNNLGLLYGSVRDHPRATLCFADSLAIRRDVLGQHHPQTLQSMGNLALAYFYERRYDESAALFEEALREWESVLLPRHVDAAKCHLNLGFCRLVMGEVPEAAAELTKALSIGAENELWSESDARKLQQILAVLESGNAETIAVLKESVRTSSAGIRI